MEGGTKRKSMPQNAHTLTSRMSGNITFYGGRDLACVAKDLEKDGTELEKELE